MACAAGRTELPVQAQEAVPLLCDRCPPNVQCKEPDVSVDVRRRCDWLLRIKPGLQGSPAPTITGSDRSRSELWGFGRIHTPHVLNRHHLLPYLARAFLGSRPAYGSVGTWQVLVTLTGWRTTNLW
jgi:hypothetical protein